MKRRDRRGIAYLRRNTLNILSRHMSEFIRMGKKYFPAFSERIRLLCIFHILDKGIDLFRLDARQIISYTDVELESRHTAKTILLCHKCEKKPRLNILLLRLGHVKLCGPLAVIALIIRLDARLIYTGRKFSAVHDLHSLKLKEPAPGVVSRRNILGKLAVRTRRRSNRRLEASPEDLLSVSFICSVRVSHPKYTSPFFMLRPYPVKEL